MTVHINFLTTSLGFLEIISYYSLTLILALDNGAAFLEAITPSILFPGTTPIHIRIRSFTPTSSAPKFQKFNFWFSFTEITSIP